MAWQADHIQTVGAAGFVAAMIGFARSLKLVRESRRWRGLWHAASVCGSSTLLAFGGGVLSAGMLVELLHRYPIAAAALGASIGVSVDMAAQNATLRLIALAMSTGSRMLESAARSRDLRQESDEKQSNSGD